MKIIYKNVFPQIPLYWEEKTYIISPSHRHSKDTFPLRFQVMYICRLINLYISCRITPAFNNCFPHVCEHTGTSTTPHASVYVYTKTNTKLHGIHGILDPLTGHDQGFSKPLFAVCSKTDLNNQTQLRYCPYFKKAHKKNGPFNIRI